MIWEDVICPQWRLVCTVKGCASFFKYLPFFLTFLLLFKTIVNVCEKGLKGRRILSCRGSFRSHISSNLHTFIIFKGMSHLFVLPFTFVVFFFLLTKCDFVVVGLVSHHLIFILSPRWGLVTTPDFSFSSSFAIHRQLYSLPGNHHRALSFSFSFCPWFSNFVFFFFWVCNLGCGFLCKFTLEPEMAKKQKKNLYSFPQSIGSTNRWNPRS